MSKKYDVFVSYSHKEDEKWLNYLNDHLKPLEDDLGINIFTDRQIKSGEAWEEKIKAALETSKVFILLLTPSFFSSDFIKNEELPMVLKSIEESGAIMLSLIVRKCRFSRVEKISKFQSINPPSQPLVSLDQHNIDDYYDSLAERIENVFTENKTQKENDTDSVIEIIENLDKMTKTKTEVSESDELGIRKEYDKLIVRVKVLKRWIENTFSEWSDQEDGIYKVDTRIKDFSKILSKAIKKIKGDEKLDIESIKKYINDIIAARIVVYNKSIIYNLHFKIMSHQRLNVESVVMHYRRGDKGHIFEDITEDPLLTDEIFTEEPNDHGYQGIHYVIKPNPIDEIHNNYPPTPLYEKFELQIRTLLQHAWSEVEHRMVYKNNLDPHSREIYRPQFSMVAEFIKKCDDLLDTLSSPIHLVESGPADEDKSNPDIKDDVKKVTELVKNMIEIKAPILQNKVTVKQFIWRNNSTIQNIKEYGLTDDKMQLGELYLRGQLAEEAYEIYKDLLSNNFYDKWVFLRFAEASDINSKKRDVLHAVNKIYEIIDDTDIPEDEKRLWSDYDHTICSQASVLAWKYNRHKLAIKLSEKALELSKDTPKFMQYKANHLYFSIEISYEKSLLENGEIDYEKLLDFLSHDDLRRIYENIKADKNCWNAPMLDTMAWYQYNIALCRVKTSKIRGVKGYINSAVNHMEKCEFNFPNPLNTLQSAHKTEIFALKRKIYAK